MFPGWHLPTLRRKPRTDAQKLLDIKERIHKMSFSRLGQYLSQYIPSSCLNLCTEKKFCRRRVFSIENTFWGFFQQILSTDGGCQEIVNQFRVIAEERGLKVISPSTSAYCQARKKLDKKILENILSHTQNHLSAEHSILPLIGRRVVVADGTGISMSDTVTNQKEWPQPKSQKDGCGFPQARICALFDLRTGVALSYRMGNKKSHELPLLRDQMDTLVKDDVFLGDKGFISYFDMSHLKTKGVDSVIGLAKRPPVSVENAKRVIADNDLIVEWSKPKGSKTRYQLNEWNGLPDTLLVRQIKVTIEQAGFRVKSFYIATTLLDDVRYPANTIAELYLKRWNVELYFREIKTTLGLDILRCKSPDMILKEVLMYFIVFNAMKLLINDNRKEILEPDEMSFNSCRQVLNAFAMRESNKSFYESVKEKSNANIMNVLKECKLLKRFGRFEPRVQKRRPKPFKLMVKPRAELKEELMGMGAWKTTLT
jgi:hypothetical protein